ncbi:DUF2950 family protein, partial [Cribrihabitans sp. XS_ASV171]
MKFARISMYAFLVAAVLPASALAQQAPSYATPQDALDALMAAFESDTPDEVLEVLGPGAEGLVRDIEPEQRRADWAVIRQG